MKYLFCIFILFSLIAVGQETKVVVIDDKEWVCEKMKRKIHKQPVKKWKCKVK